MADHRGNLLGTYNHLGLQYRIWTDEQFGPGHYIRTNDHTDQHERLMAFEVIQDLINLINN